MTLLRLPEEPKSGSRRPFSRVVLEITRLADTTSVLQAFRTNPCILDRFTLNGAVILVDLVNGPDSLGRFDGHSGEKRNGTFGHSHMHADPANAPADAATVFCFAAIGPADLSARFDAVSVLQERLGPDLLRMKGLIEI